MNVILINDSPQRDNHEISQLTELIQQENFFTDARKQRAYQL